VFTFVNVLVDVKNGVKMFFSLSLANISEGTSLILSGRNTVYFYVLLVRQKVGPKVYFFVF
jgi:hypothetical protein